MTSRPTPRSALLGLGFVEAKTLTNQCMDDALSRVTEPELRDIVLHELWVKLGEPGEFGEFAEPLVKALVAIWDGPTVADPLVGIYPAAELADRDFPPLAEYVGGLVVEGLTVLGGKPKLGKSWLALNLAVAIATGGVALGNPDRIVNSVGVLYLALEDGKRRMKERLGKLGVNPLPENLLLVHEWPRLDSGGIQNLRHALDRHPEVGVIIIDTLGRLRGPRKRGDWYGEDYQVLGELHDLTRDHPGMAVVVVHHNRKDDAPADYVDALSGSTGIGGSADVVAVLQRGRQEANAVLSITGRDIIEDERALSFNTGIWTEMGAAVDWQRTKEQQEVLALFDESDVIQQHHGVSVLTPVAVADALGIKEAAARQRLSRMAHRGELGKVDRGKYARPETLSQPSQRHEHDDETSDERDNVTDVTGFPKRADDTGINVPEDDWPVSEREALQNIMEVFSDAALVD